MKILQDNQLLTTLISPRFVFQKATTWAFIGVFFLSLSACQNNNQTTNSDSEQITEEEAIQEQLILENATLNQVDSQGNKIWTLDVSRVVYDQNQQNANLENVNGELYKNGNVFLKVKANQGTIVNDGQTINLQGKVVATDPRNGAVLRSEKIEWSPADNLIVIPNTLTANHPNFQARSNQGKYYTDQEELELMGNVEGTAEDPPLQVQSEQLNWLIPEDQVTSNQPLQVDRYNPETETISDRVTANSGRVNLAQKTVILKNNVEFKSSDPPLQAASDAITWKIESKQVSSQQPIQLVHTEDNITLTGNQGEIDLETAIARFQGGVKGISQANQATLFANRLRWNLTTEEMKAQGNVIYQQDDPPLTSKGEEASGVLQEENVVVRGTQEEQVTTELIP
jgi:LPS export ABC transporter protein LptC